MAEVNVLDVELKVSVRDNGVDGEGHWTHLVVKSGTDIIMINLPLLPVIFEINEAIAIAGLVKCLT